MSRVLTKAKWAVLKESLLHVPIRHRNIAWKEAVDLADAILKGRNNLCPDIDLKRGCFSVECALCHEPIGVDEDYVRKGVSAKYVHYDCFHKTSSGMNNL